MALVNERDEILIRHGEAGRQGLSWPSRPSWGFSKVLNRHAL